MRVYKYTLLLPAILICFQISAQKTPSVHSELWQDENLKLYDTYNPNSSVLFEEDILIGRRDIATGLAYSTTNDTIEYLYDTNGYLQQVKKSSWDTLNNLWTNQERYNHTFNNDGLRTSYNIQYWNSTDWVDLLLFEYEYNDNNLLSVFKRKDWNLGVLSESFTTFTYESDLLIHTLSQSFQNEEWINSVQVLYTNTEDLLTERTTQLWEGNTWVNSSKNIYKYNEINQRTELVSFYWYQGEWEDSVKIISEYDDQGNHILNTSQLYLGGQYENHSLSTWSYNQDNLETEFVYSRWDGSEYVNNQSTSTFYDNRMNVIHNQNKTWLDSAWIDDINFYYYYQFVNTTENIPNKHDIEVFPNPNDGHFSISFDNYNPELVQLQIMSLDGRKVFEKLIEYKNSRLNINLSHLENGAYFLSVRSNEKLVTKKIFINK